ncbi:MAG: hypothetical protein ACK4YP_09165, partial [Myxococcota bacterium]
MSRRILALLVGSAGVPGVAAAQELDADTFEISGSAFDDQGTLQLVHPHIGDPGSFYAGVGVVYAHNPLVWRFADGTKEVLVDGQLSARVAGGVNLLRRVRLDLEVPIYPWVGVSGSPTFAMGDIRLGANVPIVAYEDEGVGLSIYPFLSAPTATSGAWVSDGSFAGGAVATVGGRAGKLNWAVNLGADLGGASTVGATTLGSAMTAGAGGSYDLT